MKQAMQSINELIKGFRKTLNIKCAKRQKGLTQAWKETVGTTIASHTKLIGEKQNILYVEVDSSPIQAELANFRKKKILQKLQVSYPTKTYRDINFITGGTDSKRTYNEEKD